MVYENEEFNLIQAALNIEEDMDSLRYNKIIIATWDREIRTSEPCF
ncbi:hypothetical protein N9K77_01360 [bacterium]|nr:hypothetical protein [bacterium]